MSKSSRHRRLIAMAAQSPSGEKALSVSISETTQSLLPDPRIVEHWEKLLPGSAARIFEMTERAFEHELSTTARVAEVQLRVLEESPHIARRGQYLAGLAISLSAISAVVCAFLNQPVIGAACGLSSVTQLVGYLLHRKSEKTQTDQR